MELVVGMTGCGLKPSRVQHTPNQCDVISKRESRKGICAFPCLPFRGGCTLGMLSISRITGVLLGDLS